MSVTSAFDFVHTDFIHRGSKTTNNKTTPSVTVTPPPREPIGRVPMASSTGSPGFNPQSRTASYQRRYTNGTSSALFLKN